MAPRAVYYYHEDFNDYKFNSSPYFPAKASDAFDMIAGQGWFTNGNRMVEPPLVDEGLLLSVHDPAYIEQVKTLAPQLHRAASRITGATVAGVERLLDGRSDFVYNPLGGHHHAQYDDMSGFGIYNDVAITIKYLVEQKGKRVLYIDTDAHHCDGVQDLLKGVEGVMLVSIHQHPLFPMTGGEYHPQDNMYNFPLDPESGGKELRAAIDKIDVLVKSFKPDFIISQFGVDGYMDDPLSSLRYTVEDYIYLAQYLKDLASEYTAGAILVLGGGGYYYPQEPEEEIQYDEEGKPRFLSPLYKAHKVEISTPYLMAQTFKEFAGL